MAVDAPTIYMATHGHNKSLNHFDADCAPALLVSYAYLQSWATAQRRASVVHRHWILDSGAYSAFRIGVVISLEEYTAVARDLWQADQKLREIIALDVIGDWRTSKRNVERMWQAGVPAMPVYHLGEPEDLLIGYASDYPKVCIGGVYNLKGRAEKARYVEAVFARVWPCALHALAVSVVEDMLLAPWHSADSSSAFRGANGFGTWQGYASVRGRKWTRLSSLPADYDHDVRVEVKRYMRSEATLRHRWAREMDEVSARLTAAGWRGYEGRTDAVCEDSGVGRGPAPVA